MQRLRAVELGAAPAAARRVALATSGTRSTSKAAPPVDAEPRLDLRGVGLRFARLRLAFGGGDANQLAAGADAAAALDRRRDDAAGDFGGDLGVFLRRSACR